MVTTPLKYGSGHALLSLCSPPPDTIPTIKEVEPNILSKGVQSKLSTGRGSMPKKGRRDQVNAEEHNFCVSESKEKRLYIHPTQT